VISYIMCSILGWASTKETIQHELMWPRKWIWIQHVDMVMHVDLVWIMLETSLLFTSIIKTNYGMQSELQNKGQNIEISCLNGG
jgi:hypothetical protein